MGSEQSDSLSRRALLRGSLLAGGATFLPRGPFGDEVAVAGDASGTKPAADARIFFHNPRINFEVLFGLGSAGYGAAEFGEVATIINRIDASGKSYDAVYTEFRRTGRRVREIARHSRSGGHDVSARGAFLRAAEYLAFPVFFAIGTSRPSRQAEAYREMQECWHAATQLFSPPFERVQVPYGRSTFPGYFLRPPGPRRRRPTIILNNGNDAQNIGLYVFGGAAAIERGYNALIFEGPGQGSVFFLRRIPFRPDWENVITPIVDFLHGRSDVDRKRIGIIGWSQGGLLVTRAAAFERRLAAVVADPGGVDIVRGLNLPAGLLKLVNEGKREEANRAWDEAFRRLPPVTRFAYTKLLFPFGHKTFYDQIRYLERFNVSGVISQITAPTLVTDYQYDDFFAGQPQEVYRRLRSKKRLVRFTSEDGTEYHDAPMAPQRRNQVLFDWLDDVLTRPRGRG